MAPSAFPRCSHILTILLKRPLSTPSAPGKLLKMKAVTSLSEATFCEGVESGHSSHSQQASIAAALNITNPSVRMDSQAKYATLVRGVADIYLRLPTSATYEEKIWVCRPPFRGSLP